jgi:galactose mutarotase-like enzyme
MKRLTLGVAVLLSIAVARSAAAQPYSSRRNGDVVQLEDTRSRTVVSIALSVGNIAFEMKINGANVLWWPYASVEEFKAKPAQSGFPSSGWANRLDEQAFTRTAPYAFDTAPERPGAIPIHGFLTTNPTGSSWSGADASSAWVTSRLEFTNNPRG